LAAILYVATKEQPDVMSHQLNSLAVVCNQFIELRIFWDIAVLFERDRLYKPVHEKDRWSQCYSKLQVARGEYGKGWVLRVQPAANGWDCWLCTKFQSSC